MEYDSSQYTKQPAELFKTDRGKARMVNVSEFRVGAGATTVMSNRDGFFIGSNAYSLAPFAVDYYGNVKATTGTIAGNFSITGALYFNYNTSNAGRIYADNSVNMIYIARNSHDFFDASNHYIGRLFHDSTSSYGLELQSGSIIQFPSGRSMQDYGAGIQFNGDIKLVNSSSQLLFSSGRYIKDSNDSVTIGGGLKFDSNSFISWPSGRSLIATNSSIQISGDLEPQGNLSHDCGTQANFWNNVRARYFIVGDHIECKGQSGDDYDGIGFITSVQINNKGDLQAKFREITTRGGIVTNITNESSWENM